MAIFSAKKTIKTVVIIGAITSAVKFVSIAKELMVASFLGTGDALDAFLIAFSLPTFVVNVAFGPFHSAFLPAYIQALREGEQAARRMFCTLLAFSLVLSLAIAGLLALLAPWLLPVFGSGFSPEKLALTRRLFYLLLPVIVLAGLSNICSSTLNARGRFALPALSLIGVPALTGAILIGWGENCGIYALVAGAVGGFALELCLLAWGLWLQKISMRPSWHKNSGINRVIPQYLAVVAGTSMSTGTLIVDQAMAGMLAPGNVAALSYGSKLLSLPLSICTIAMGTAIFPYFSSLVAEENWRQVRSVLKKYAFAIVAFSLPATLFCVYFSEPLVRMAFERGAFTRKDTLVVSHIQAFYFLQMPFYLLNILMARLSSALKANRILMWASMIYFVFNVILNWVLMQWYAVAGIALATSIMYLVSCCYLALALRGELRKAES